MLNTTNLRYIVVVLCFLATVSGFRSPSKLLHPPTIQSDRNLEPIDGLISEMKSTPPHNQHGRRSSYTKVSLLESRSDITETAKMGESVSSTVKMLGGLVVAATAAVVALNAAGVHGFNPQEFLENTVTKVSDLGPYGYLYFSMVYIAAEVLLVPVLPLTASSGYLFGLVPGTIVTLTSATIAASISFFIGRTLLRDWVREKAADNKQWRAVDGAIGKDGFKIILLLRLSPLFPLTLSNYLYGITAVDFWQYFAATLLGFAPGTIGFVYAGSAGKALMGEGMSLPWYGYVAVGGFILFTAQTIAKIATDAVKAEGIEDLDTDSDQL